MVLKKTNENCFNIEYLDFKIDIVNNFIKIGVFDKRKAFNFNVIFFCNFKTNLCSKIFKNLVFSQLVRIKKICNNVESFREAVDNFLNNFSNNYFLFNFCNVNFLIKKMIDSF